MLENVLRAGAPSHAAGAPYIFSALQPESATARQQLNATFTVLISQFYLFLIV